MSNRYLVKTYIFHSI